MEEIIAFDDHVFIPEKKCEGNRRGRLVELYDNNVFFTTVHTRQIKLA